MSKALRNARSTGDEKVVMEKRIYRVYQKKGNRTSARYYT